MRIVDESYGVPAEVQPKLRRAFWLTLAQFYGFFVAAFAGAWVLLWWLDLAAPGPAEAGMTLGGMLLLYAMLRRGAPAKVTAFTVHATKADVVAAIVARHKAACVTAVAGGAWIAHGAFLAIRVWVEDAPDGCRIVGPSLGLPTVRRALRRSGMDGTTTSATGSGT